MLAALGSLMWLALGLQWFRGIRDVPVLEDLRKPGVPERNPSLSVVVAARDEQRDVGEGVGSVLAQDYSGGLEGSCLPTRTCASLRSASSKRCATRSKKNGTT